MFQRVRVATEKAHLLPDRTHSQIGSRALVPNLSGFTDWWWGEMKWFWVSSREERKWCPLLAQMELHKRVHLPLAQPSSKQAMARELGTPNLEQSSFSGLDRKVDVSWKRQFLK